MAAAEVLPAFTHLVNPRTFLSSDALMPVLTDCVCCSGLSALKLAQGVLRLLTAATFNSEVVPGRWRLLNPAPLTFTQVLTWVVSACGPRPSRQQKGIPSSPTVPTDIPRPLKSAMRPISKSDLSTHELDAAVASQASLVLSVSSAARLPAHAHAANIRERSRLRRQQRKEREELLAGLTHEERVQVSVIRATARVREETALRLSITSSGIPLDGDGASAVTGLLSRPRADSEVSSIAGSDGVSQESPYLGPALPPRTRTPALLPLTLSAASPLLTPMITPLASSASNPGTCFLFPDEGTGSVRPSTSEGRLNTVTRPPLTRHSSLLGPPSPYTMFPSGVDTCDGDPPEFRPGTAPDKFRHQRSGSVVTLLSAATSTRKGSVQFPLRFSTENHKHRHGRSASSVSLNLVLDPVEIAAAASSAVSPTPSPEVPAVTSNTIVIDSRPSTPSVPAQPQCPTDFVIPTFPVASVADLRQLEADFATAVRCPSLHPYCFDSKREFCRFHPSGRIGQPSRFARRRRRRT
jgi:hypothetical protein